MSVEIWAVIAGDDAVFEEGAVRVEQTSDLVGVVASTVGVNGKDVERVGLEEERAERGTEAAPVAEEAPLVEDVKGVDLEAAVVEVFGTWVDGGMEEGEVNIEDQVEFPGFREGLGHVSMYVGGFSFGDRDVMPTLDKDPCGLLGVACFLLQHFPAHGTHAAAL